MDISVAIPNDLIDVSNGRFVGKTDLGDGYTRWDWHVHYPINNYNVSVNIGHYEHFTDTLGDLTLDLLRPAREPREGEAQFAQAKPMIEAFQQYFGEYPFKKDGYKLIEVPYSGMEHQSAVTYGNRFANGYLERDWTGVGISPKFDFIIIHESGHEWFGNAVIAADVSDMWIHEGWTTYLECLYVETLFGHDDALKYTNGYKIEGPQPRADHHAARHPPHAVAGQYFKGALFLNTLRSVVNDDAQWWQADARLLPDVQVPEHHDRGHGRFFNQQLGTDLTPIFDQYLRRTALPVLELKFDEPRRHGRLPLEGRRAGFAMPIKVGRPAHWQTASRRRRTGKSMQTPLTKDDVRGRDRPVLRERAKR